MPVTRLAIAVGISGAAAFACAQAVYGAPPLPSGPYGPPKDAAPEVDGADADAADSAPD